MAESKENISTVKSATEAIAQKAKGDAAFAAKLKNDPVSTLRAEGLPDAAISESLTKWGVEPEVSGYSYVQMDECVYYTSYVEYYWECTYYTS